jgi:AraC-like DNA-binding protein
MIKLLDIGFRFGAIALLGLLGLLIFRERHERLSSWIAIAFSAGLIAYLLCSAPFWGDLPTWLQAILMLGCIANPLLFWLLARSIFEDGFRLRFLHALLFVGVEVLGYWYVFGLGTERGSPMSMVAGGVSQFVAVAFVIDALITAYRGRNPDLVESRRRFRVLFVSVVGVYMTFVIMVEILLRGAAPHAVASMLNAGAICGIVFLVAVWSLGVKFNLLLEPVRPAAAVELDLVERALLQRLDEAIAKQRYRQEGLTIGALARELQTQEHKLRALVNARMGFRNFNDFLNQHRIADACVQLADPAFAGAPVLTIALNLGYGSIGPFNRAFKQATGLTPTQYRRQKLGQAGASRPMVSEEGS